MLNRIGNLIIRSGQRLENLGKHIVGKTRLPYSLDTKISALSQFWFLADSPLYIDDLLVSKLFDAIFRPEFEASSRTVTGSRSESTEDVLEAVLAAEASVPTIFKLAGTGKTAFKRSALITKSEAHLELAVKSAERRLERLLTLYAYSYPDRVLWVKPNLLTLSDLQEPQIEQTWDRIEQLLDVPKPRPLIVFELEKGTKLLPMFAERTTGQPIELYDKYLDELKTVDPAKRKLAPIYPSDGESQKKQQEYWRFFDEVFDSRLAMRAVEGAGRIKEEARIEWIDYRLFGHEKNGKVVPIHLHLIPRGNYPAGTFAYQFIRRGFKYGLKIVGTLKKGYDINVLAIYER